jgi:hypothetical protein
MKLTKVRWLRTSHISVLGACWKHAKAERKDIVGKKACTREATTGRKNTMCACMEDLTTLGLGFLQYIVMAGKTKMHKYRYLCLIEGDQSQTVYSES